MIWIALLTALAACIAGASRWLASRRLRNLANLERHRNGFFEAAEALATDTRTPPHLAGFYVGLSFGLTNQWLPYVLFFLPRLPRPQLVKERVETLWREIRQLPADLRPLDSRMRYHGLMVIALQNAIVGPSLAKRIERLYCTHREHDNEKDGDSLFREVVEFQAKFPPKNQALRELAVA